MADIDLTQYNGTPNFPPTAQVGTGGDPYLVPTDGKTVTADSNLTDEAPVNRSLKQTKDLLLGLRDGIVGDRMTAARKTLRSVHADGQGAMPNTAPAGDVWADQQVQALNGDIIAQIGNVVTTNGNVLVPRTGSYCEVGEAPNQHAQLRVQKLAFLNVTTGAADSANPPPSTPIRNELRAANIPKVGLFLTMSAPGVVATVDGFGVSSIGFIFGILVVNFAIPFADVRYSVTSMPVPTLDGTRVLAPYEDNVMGRSVNSCQIHLWDLTNSSYTGFDVRACNLQLHIFGRQSS